MIRSALKLFVIPMTLSIVIPAGAGIATTDR